MIVKKEIRIYEDVDLDITGATLLTVEEARELPIRLRKYNNWWWLKSSGDYETYVAFVLLDGFVNNTGYYVNDNYIAVRPALIISNLESSGLKIGDTFKFGEKQFEIISNDKAFCLSDIGYRAFRRDLKASDANDYEKSDVKKFVDEWFGKACRDEMP